MDASVRRQFLADYGAIRRSEERGSDNAQYYRELPFRDLTGRHSDQWKIRACSYRHLERTILRKLERQTNQPLDIIDLGAGNGWMSNQLAQRGHRVTALDIFSDARDGLGALVHYGEAISGVLAEFDALPFREASFDFAIFNSSFHYSSDYARTLGEARRCLKPGGWIIIMDTPVYRASEHGELMREERRRHFESLHGFRSDALGSIEYLDHATLDNLAREFNLELHRSEPWYGIAWALRPWKARLQGRRPPSKFMILAARFRE